MILIKRSNVPKEEHERVQKIEAELRSLKTHLRDFNSALELFDHASIQNPMKTSWMHIAAQHGAIQLYAFGRTLISFLPLYLKDTPNLAAQLDTSLLTEARKEFNIYFPYYTPVRLAAAHTADLRNEIEEHLFEGHLTDFGMNVNGKIMMQNNLKGRTYFSTVKGEVVSYDISCDSLNVLKKVQETTYLAFRKVAIHWPPL